MGARATVPAFFFITEDQTGAFVHAGQELYKLSYFLSPCIHSKIISISVCIVETLSDLLEVVSYLVSTVQRPVVEINLRST